jgi:3-mercaptopyruvate sulfurtransferase SseA
MILALMFIFVSSVTSFAGYKGFVRDDSLITPQQLKELIDKKDPNLVILAVAKTTDYRTGHIPGALQIWRGDYEPARDKPYPYGGMILNRTEFEKFARDLGINNDSTVVIYDHKYDSTRVWWAFFLYGKRDCKVLDGGFQGWKKAGYDTKIFAPDKPKQGNFVAKPPPRRLDSLNGRGMAGKD